MFRIAICGDESMCSEIEQAIIEYGKGCIGKVDVDVFYSGEELCDCMQNGVEVDLIFLDIIVRNTKGIETAKFIRNVLANDYVQIVFLSDQEECHRELFGVRPLNLLVKPVDFCELYREIDKAVALSEKQGCLFSFKQGTVVHKEALRDIFYFESNGRKIRIVAQTGIYSFYGKLGEVHSELKEANFLMIHQSYLVNHRHIVEYGRSVLKLANGESLPISREKRKQVLLQIENM